MASGPALMAGAERAVDLVAACIDYTILIDELCTRRCAVLVCQWHFNGFNKSFSQHHHLDT